MNKEEAIKYLKEALSEIPRLSNLAYNNTEYPVWLETIRGVIIHVFGKESYEYQQLSKIYSLSRNFPQNSYKQNLKKRAIALESIIKAWETLGLETDTIEVPETPEVHILTSDWEGIKKEFGVSKTNFSKKINFVKDQFKREIIFRDVEQSFALASTGYSKPAVILAGGVIEELLRLYLLHKGMSPQKPLKKDFNGYIQTCVNNRLLKDSVSHLSDSVRQFRNLVHVSAEKDNKYTISKATAKGAVSSIFTIANDFR